MDSFFLWDHLLYHCVLPLLGILELSKKVFPRLSPLTHDATAGQGLEIIIRNLD
jgi:hypothetical protein